MAMAIALFGVLWPLIALAIALLHELFTRASVFDKTVYVGILNNVFINCFNCERKALCHWTSSGVPTRVYDITPATNPPTTKPSPTNPPPTKHPCDKTHLRHNPLHSTKLPTTTDGQNSKKLITNSLTNYS